MAVEYQAGRAVTEIADGFPKLRDIDEPPERTVAQKRGKRNNEAGKRFQRKARKVIERLTGKSAARFLGQLGNEESWHGLPWRVECKYGLTNHPVVTWYENARTQAEANHAIGDPRPFVFVCGTARSKVLAVIELEHDLPAVADSLAKSSDDSSS
jgi:hypothetical protein